MDGESDKPSAAAAETIFIAALELPPARRPAFLATACGDNQKLRRRVEALLRADEAPESFLPEQPGPVAAAAPTAAELLAAQLTKQPGDLIGRYKLLEKLGEGGCGVVYMAQQEEPIRRKVALKVIKLGMDTRQVVGRFEAERQALALMEHPNIAKVLDAGATETGRPYFVMELVGGIKITDYCDQNQLTTRQRLDLFIQVCLAVQHAHQKGVIHRDLKPSNVLVATQDGVPVPKVIDFGIAKATQGRLTDQTVFTAFEQFLGTPAYMSPEQAQLGGLDIDTRSDIYSLGVLLYELLTGKTPFDAKELLAAGLEAMRRTIQEQEPPTPSTRLKQDTAARAAGSDKSALRTPHSAIDPDLDWIVMKCLEKDRTRRYETANGLARDIERHLSSEPVMASPPGNLYRFQKLVRRKKVLFSAGAVIVTVLVLGVVAITWQAIRATRAERDQSRLRQQAQTAQANEARQREAAQTEAARSAQVAQFMKDMLKGVGPSVALGRDTTMLREILDKTAESIGKELTNQPAVEAELRSAIGSVYFELGEDSKAELMYRQSLDLRRHLWGNENLAIAETLTTLANVLRRTIKADADEPERLERQALAIYEKSFGRQHPSVGASLNSLGFLLNKPEAAEVVLREALAINLKTLGEEHPQVGLSLSRLGTVLEMQGKLTEAETTLSNAVTIQRKALSEQTTGFNPLVELGWTLTHLADVLGRQNKLAEAVTAQREAVAMLRRALGDDHPHIPPLLGGLSRLLMLQGKLADAETTLRELRAICGKLLGKENDQTVSTLNGIALILGGQGMLAERKATAREALAISRKLHATGHTTSLPSVLQTIAYTFYLEGKFGEAEPLYREAVALSRESGTVDSTMAHLLNNFAGTLSAQDKLEEAESFFREALMMRRQLFGEDHPDVMYSLGTLAGVLDAQGKWKEAAAVWRHAAERGRVPALNAAAWFLATSPVAEIRDPPAALLYAEKAIAATGRTNANYLDTLAVAFAAAGQFSNAVRVQQEAIALLRDEEQKRDYGSRLRLFEANTPYRDDRALANQASYLLTQGKSSEAETLLRECLTLCEKQIPDDWRTFNTKSMLGGALLGQQRYSDAAPLLVSGYEGMKEREAKIPAAGKIRLKEALERLLQLSEATDRPDQAAEWKQKLVEFAKATE